MREKQVIVKIGKRIQLLRKERKLSQEALAELTGMHPTYISDIERAKVNTSILSFHKISKALNLTLSEIFDIPSERDEKKNLILQKIFILLRKQRIESLEFIELCLSAFVKFVSK